MSLTDNTLYKLCQDVLWIMIYWEKLDTSTCKHLNYVKYPFVYGFVSFRLIKINFAQHLHSYCESLFITLGLMKAPIAAFLGFSILPLVANESYSTAADYSYEIDNYSNDPVSLLKHNAVTWHIEGRKCQILMIMEQKLW